MGAFQPGFVEGAVSALLISIVAGLLVAWLLRLLRSQPKLTWEVLTKNSLNKFPIFLEYEEDAKGGQLGIEEYSRRLAELGKYEYLCVFRILNRGNKSAENIRVLLHGRPSYVDTWEKQGIEVKEFGDGVFEIKVGSLASDGYATISFLGPSSALRDIRVEYKGVFVPLGRTLSEERRMRRNTLQATLFYTALGLISFVIPVYVIFFE